MTQSHTQPHTSVLILGAGYAGLLCATRLARKTHGHPVSITLVNENDTFTERLRLHQFATNQTIPWRSIPAMLRGTGVRFIQGRVTALALDEKAVTLTHEGQQERLTYDYLVYALGSVTERASVPGVADYAYTLAPHGERSATALRAALPPLQATGGHVVVCGGGATGIETAAEFASAYPNIEVRLVTNGSFGQFVGDAVAKRMRRALTQLGVIIADHTTISAVHATDIQTADGRTFPYDLCVWAGGFQAPPLAREAGFIVNERGQIVTDPYLRSLSHPAVFALGDAAHSREQPGAPLRMSAVTAMIMGMQGANSVNAVLRGKTPRPFSFAYAGQGIALGRRNGIGFAKTADDVAYPPYFMGRAAVAFRTFGLNYLAGAPAREKHWLTSILFNSVFLRGRNRYAAAQRQRVALEGAQVRHA